jgi:23S rRNA (cytosine1962-C5)-methyltransferase
VVVLDVATPGGVKALPVSVALTPVLDAALRARASLFDARHEAALRLFNGFVEGLPSLVIDLYGRTLVIHDYAESEAGDEALAREALDQVLRELPWVTCAVWKIRRSKSVDLRNGGFLLGGEKEVVRRVTEAGVSYVVATTLNRDVGFYLDTRPLRAWAKASLVEKRVLNAFAYTGSLGVAARAGGAEVLHTDLSRRSLNVAKDSYSLNGWTIRKRDFRVGDFFDVVGQLKRERQLFDCVFLDPPSFSVTPKGRIDLQAAAERVINKVRPLIADGGALVSVNNSEFLRGADYLKSLEALCADGYLSLEQTVPVPEDTTGYPTTRVRALPVDPSPFNHSTKMVILRVRRKDGMATTAGG